MKGLLNSFHVWGSNVSKLSQTHGSIDANSITTIFQFEGKE